MYHHNDPRTNINRLLEERRQRILGRIEGVGAAPMPSPTLHPHVNAWERSDNLERGRDVKYTARPGAEEPQNPMNRTGASHRSLTHGCENAASTIIFTSVDGTDQMSCDSSTENQTIGTLKSYLCRRRGLVATKYVVVSPEGRIVSDEQWASVVALQFGAQETRLIFMDMDKVLTPVVTVRDPEIAGSETIQMSETVAVTATWEPVEQKYPGIKDLAAPVQLSEPLIKRSKVETAIDYHAMPMDIFKLMVANVSTPLLILDLRQVCRRWRDHIDENIWTLMQPFYRHASAMCAVRGVSNSARLGDKRIIGKYERQHKEGLATVLRAVHHTCVSLPLPDTTEAMTRIARFLFGTPYDEHSKGARRVVFQAMAKGRAPHGKCISDPKRPGDAVAVKARFSVVARKKLPNHQGVIALNSHYVIVKDEYPWEMWWDPHTEQYSMCHLSLVKTHAVIKALRYVFWENADLYCSKCGDPVKQSKVTALFNGDVLAMVAMYLGVF